MAALIRFVLAALVTGILAYGFYDYLTNFEPNQCEMTWMFEYPEYIPIKFNADSTKETFPRYKLYLYGEGVQAEKLRLNGPDGLPVVFIPGNGGSFKQVRSLASVALRMAEGHPIGSHFDFFTIDFKEELSGLYGGTLKKQIDFVDECMHMVMSLYQHPRKIILIGHSMGGVIARAVRTFQTHWQIGTIITFASPHQAPVVTLDRMQYELYNRINNELKQNFKTAPLTIVSIGGGFRDIMVRNGLTALNWVAHSNRSFSVSTTAIPNAWVSTDHLCAVWCRQVVKATVRALFDLIYHKNGHFYTQTETLMRILRHHFVSNPGVAKYKFGERVSRLTLQKNIQWLEQKKPFWHFTSEMEQALYLVSPLPTTEDLDSVTVLSNITSEAWICLCTPSKETGRCHTCEDLSLFGKIVPPQHSKKKYFQMSLAPLRHHTHIVVIVPKLLPRVEVFVDFYLKSKRHLLFSLPGVWDLMLSYPFSLLGGGSAMLHVRNGSLYHSLHLGGLTHPLRTFHAVILPRKCRQMDTGYYEGNLLSLDVPWSHEGSYQFSRYGEPVEIKLKLHTAQPSRSKTDDAVHLEMFLHPGCSYQLRIYFSTKDFLGQFVRIFGPLLPSAFVAILLMTIRGQIVQALQKDEDNRGFSAVWNRAKPFYVLPAVFVGRAILGSGLVSRLSARAGLAVEDSVPLQRAGLWFTSLPLLLMLLAFFITYLYVTLTYWWTAVLSYPVGWLCSWCPSAVKERGWMLELVWLGFSFIIAYFICGSLSLFPLYLLVLFKVLRACRQSTQSGSEEDQQRFNFLFFLMLLILWQLALSAPQLVIWARDIRDGYSWFLKPDPSSLASTITILAAAIVTKEDLLHPRTTLLTVGWSLYGVAVLTLLFAVTSLFRIAYFSTLTWVILAVPQVLRYAQAVLDPPKDKDE